VIQSAPEIKIEPTQKTPLMTRSEKALALSSSVVILVLLAFLALLVLQLVDTSTEREISGPVTIGPEWQELRPAKSLKVQRRAQTVLLYPVDAKQSIERNFPQGSEWGLLLPDGTVVKPQLVAIDEYGNAFPLDSPSFQQRTNAAGEAIWAMGLAGGQHNLPSDRTYPLIRIRSDKPLRLSKVSWYCWSPM
jgi:hypothetical protein